MERRRVVVVYIDVEPISSHILFITFYMFFFYFESLWMIRCIINDCQTFTVWLTNKRNCKKQDVS